MHLVISRPLVLVLAGLLMTSGVCALVTLAGAGRTLGKAPRWQAVFLVVAVLLGGVGVILWRSAF